MIRRGAFVCLPVCLSSGSRIIGSRSHNFYQLLSNNLNNYELRPGPPIFIMCPTKSRSTNEWWESEQNYGLLVVNPYIEEVRVESIPSS